MGALRLIQAYYLSSPLFFLFGIWWGVELRASFIPGSGLRFLYYVGISGLGLLTYLRPRAAPWVAMGESSVNLFLILLWILLPVFELSEAALERGAMGVPYTPLEVLVNGGLAGSFFIVGFHRGRALAMGGDGSGGGRRRRRDLSSLLKEFAESREDKEPPLS